MKRFYFSLLIAFFTISFLPSSAQQTFDVKMGERPPIDYNRLEEDAYDKGILMIKFKSDFASHLELNHVMKSNSGHVIFSLVAVDELNQKYMVREAVQHFLSPALGNTFTERHKAWGFHLWYKLELDERADIKQLVREYSALSEIEIAEPSFKKAMIGHVDFFENPTPEGDGKGTSGVMWTPNDPMYNTQWHYHNTGQQGGTVDKDIDLPEAWDIEKGNSNVIVAIVDDGIQFNHPDLAGNMWSGIGYNFVAGNSTVVPGNHGTHVAGTVAAVNNNGTGVAGVAGGSGSGDGVRLMSCQVFQGFSSGGFHLAPIYAADNGAAISQNSWGYTSPGYYEQSVLDAIDYFNTNGGGSAMLNGGITIFAAGNSNSNAAYYPGYYSGTLAVAATNNQDIKAYFGSSTSASNYGTWVDLSAPGGETYQISAKGVRSTVTGSSYDYYQGTSMACPHVSGVAALIISLGYGSFTPTNVKNILKNTTDNIDAQNPGFIGQLGTGRMNAYSALVLAQSMITGPPAASFAANNTMPVNSSTLVVFTDQSTSLPTSWSWTFSPSTVTYAIGFSSASQNPQVYFNNPGAYSVTLYVQNAYGNDSEIKTNYIHQGQPGAWTGNTSVDWNTVTNWQNHLVPATTDNVYITPAAINWPTRTENLIIGNDCGNISMASNAQLSVTGNLTINAGSQLYSDANATIFVGGDWTNYGTFNPGAGLVVFNGTSASTINSPPGGPVYMINDNFSSWPGNWNGNLGGGNGQFSQQSSSFAGGASPEARFLWESNSNATRRMYHNAINTSGLTSLSLTFRHYIDHFSSSGTYTCKIQYSTDAVTWYDAGWSVSPNGNISATQVSLNLTGAQGVGASNYYLSFTITGNLYNIDYWYIDDVHLSYPTLGIAAFNNLEINKTNSTVSTNGDINVNGAFVIRPGAYFTNSTGDIFNVLGSALFMADPTGMASFIDNGTSTFAFPPQVQLFMTPDSWHFVSSPVQGSLSGLFTNYFLYSFDELTDSWFNVIPTDVPLNTMQGYSVWVPANPAMVTFSGTLNNGALSIPVTRNTTQTDQGWNLVGNPYPSSLDWNSAAWTKTNVNNTIYYYSGAGGLNNYKYYIGSGGETPGVGVNTGTNLIPPLQGFFVHASGTGTLDVNNNARIHSNQAYYKSDEEMSTDWPLIRIVAEANGLSDETVIRFLDPATPEFDGDYDALKLFAATYPQVWSVYGATDYAVNTLPEVHDDLVIPISFVNPETTDYSLYFSEINGMPGQVLFLEDLLLGEIHDIEENKPVVFNFTSSQNSDRFLLHFSHPLGAIENQASSSSIYSHGNVVYIHLHEEVNAEIVVHDLIGREILRKTAGKEKLIRLDIQSETGYYLVSVIAPDHMVSKKVFLK